MKCPLCKVKLYILDTRACDNDVTRRRECPECLTRFETTETITRIPTYMRDELKKRATELELQALEANHQLAIAEYEAKKQSLMMGIGGK